MIDIHVGDILFLAQASNPMVEHLVKVDDMSDGIIIATKAVTLTKMQLPDSYEMITAPFPPFGITSNKAALEGGDPSPIYITLNHFDGYGVVKNKKVLDMFTKFTSKLISVMSPDEAEEMVKKRQALLGDKANTGNGLIV